MWINPRLSPGFLRVSRVLLILVFVGNLLPAAAAAAAAAAAPGQMVISNGEDAPLKHRFTVVTAQYRRLMNCGKRVKLDVVIQNDGDLAWGSDRHLRVSYRWRKIGEKRWQFGIRTALPENVAPGAAVEMTVDVLAPESAGLYDFRWDLVEEKVGWFSRTDPTPAPEHRFVALPFDTLLLLVLTGLVAVFSVIAVLWARSARGLPFSIPPEADVYWLVAALVIKQTWVLVSTGWPPEVSGIWVTLAIMALVALILMLIPQRVRPWTTWGVNALLSALLCADAVYIRFFHDLPSFALMGAGKQTTDVMGSFVSLLKWSDLWFFSDLLPALLLTFFLSRQVLTRPRRLVVMGIWALLLLPGTWVLWGPNRVDRGAAFHHRFHIKIAQRVGVFGYHISSARTLFLETLWSVSITEGDWRLVTGVLEERRPQRAGSGDFFGVARGFNLVIIQVESLQSQLLGIEVNGQEVTPNLNRLANSGVSFTFGIDQTSWGRTSDAELLSQASLLPDSNGPAVFRHEGNDLVGLADILGENGYSTLVAVPFRESFWNRRWSHPAFGFKTRLYDGDFEPGPKVGWGLNDRDFLQQSVIKLRELPEPFFGYLITLSNHHPFLNFPSEFEILDLEGLETGTLSGYLHSMRWADEAIGGFLKSLEDGGLGSRTVIVVFGDHGAGLQRSSDGSGVMNFGSNIAQRILSERVPVVIRVPAGNAPGGEVDLPMGLIDLPPTIAALLGIDPEALPWLGRNLFGSPGAGPVIIGGRAWVDGRHVYSDSTQRCFDRYTGERVNPERCDENLISVQRLRAAGALILAGDLQQELRVFLEEGVVPDWAQ